VEHGSDLRDGDISNFVNVAEELRNHRWVTSRPSSPLRDILKFWLRTLVSS
jgi:hypothetical protein